MPSKSICCCCRQVTSVLSNSVWPHRRQPTRLPCPWDCPGKNTGMGCHFLLQCMKVKLKSLSCVPLSVTPWTTAYQAPPSMGFSRQEHWSGVPLPSLQNPSVLLQIAGVPFKWLNNIPVCVYVCVCMYDTDRVCLSIHSTSYYT